jgi:hypothetical protein
LKQAVVAIAPVAFRVDVSFRIQQHFAHVDVEVTQNSTVQGSALAEKEGDSF